MTPFDPFLTLCVGIWIGLAIGVGLAFFSKVVE